LLSYTGVRCTLNSPLSHRYGFRDNEGQGKKTPEKQQPIGSIG